MSHSLIENVVSRVPGPVRRYEGHMASCAMRDFMVSTLDLDFWPEIAGIAPIGDDPYHYRVDLAKDFATGHSEFCAIADGFFVSINDFALSMPVTMAGSAPDMLRVWIASDGNCNYAPTPDDTLDVSGAGAWLLIDPPGTSVTEAVSLGHHRAVQVFIHRDALRLLYAHGEAGLPPVIRTFIAGELDHVVACRLPLAPGLLRCLDDLHNCALEAGTRRLYVQSKAVELLCHAFESLAHEDSFGSAETSALTARGVVKARQLLAEQFVSPPTLDDLAHQVGLSRSSLCAGFRQVVGKTVFDYIADLRMEHALEMLKQQGTTISQIAYAVGYTHPSSFSIAVQRRFGTTPSALRRGQMAGAIAS